MRYDVISADNHFNEPGDVFLPRMPAKFKDRAPRIVPTPDGGEGWLWEGQVPQHGFGLGSAVYAKGKVRSPEEYIQSGLKLSDLAAGSYDPKAAVEDMKKDGVDAGVFYPSVANQFYSVKDKEFRLALFRAYNDWQVDWCSHDPKRLIGLAILPTTEDTPDEAVTELKRAVKLGFKGVLLPIFPKRHYDDPWYDPIWTAAQDADVPVNTHRGVGGGLPGFGVVGEGPWFSSQVQRDFAYALPVGDLIFGKVFDRFPRLKWVSGEGRIGWMIHFVQRADESYRRHRHWIKFSMKKLPSDYVKENIYTTFIEDRMGVLAREYIGVDNQMWSSDYPHSDSTWPYSRQKIEEQFKGVPEADKRKMVALNAAQLYKLS